MEVRPKVTGVQRFMQDADPERWLCWQQVLTGEKNLLESTGQDRSGLLAVLHAALLHVHASTRAGRRCSETHPEGDGFIHSDQAIGKEQGEGSLRYLLLSLDNELLTSDGLPASTKKKKTQQNQSKTNAKKSLISSVLNNQHILCSCFLFFKLKNICAATSLL